MEEKKQSKATAATEPLDDLVEVRVKVKRRHLNRLTYATSRHDYEDAICTAIYAAIAAPADPVIASGEKRFEATAIAEQE